MFSRKKALTVVLVVGLFACGVIAAVAAEGDTGWQIIAKVDELLEKNPLARGEKAQMIKIAEDDTITAYVIRMAPGAELGPHVHRTHNEIEYFIRGTALLFVNESWVEVRPGIIHFNPMGKAHGMRNTGSEPFVALIAFTPAMRETDRHFLK
ncbi:MAG TPA: cupin domain-containing protein [Syntrophobacteria bacterium]|nr:cupin domain-containing protein [Syntrophobacteria bacterium]